MEMLSSHDRQATPRPSPFPLPSPVETITIWCTVSPSHSHDLSCIKPIRLAATATSTRKRTRLYLECSLELQLLPTPFSRHYLSPSGVVCVMRDNLKVLCGFFLVNVEVLPKPTSCVCRTWTCLSNLHINSRLIKLSVHLQRLMHELYCQLWRLYSLFVQYKR